MLNSRRSWAEIFAERELEKLGWQVLDRNLRFGFGTGCGQVDLLARDKTGLLWVLEVKSASLSPRPTQRQIRRIKSSFFFLKQSGRLDLKNPVRGWGGWALVLVDREGWVEVLENPC
jgi:Holliday junction resolvase-like predicted endonuclease